MFCVKIDNFSRNSYFQVGRLHVSVRVLILVCILLRPVFVHLKMSYPLKDLNLHLYQRFWYSLIHIITPLSSHTEIEDTSFHQELYATNQYCWVNNFKSTILCQVFVHPKLNLLCPQLWPSLGAPVTGGYTCNPYSHNNDNHRKFDVWKPK